MYYCDWYMTRYDHDMTKGYTRLCEDIRLELIIHIREPTWIIECKNVDHPSMTSNHSTFCIGNLPALMPPFFPLQGVAFVSNAFLVDDISRRPLV